MSRKVEEVLVLGGEEVTSIGMAIQTFLIEQSVNCVRDPCVHPDSWHRYNIPPMTRDPDALVVALGSCSTDRLVDMGEDRIADILRANLYLPLIAAKEFMSVRRGLGGKVVFIGSYNHDHPLTNGTAYSAAKAGLAMAVKSLAWDCAPTFAFFMVNPWQVPYTPMSDAVAKDEAARRGTTVDSIQAYAQRDNRQKAPLNIWDVAEVVHDLLMSKRSHWLNGTGIDMYGGVR
jgi:NAD(P)-dependent dehydrogenase (short-subunit alcohol dehydrogenase family)